MKDLKQIVERAAQRSVDEQNRLTDNYEIIKEFEELAHAYFEPGDKDYWDAIEYSKSFILSKLNQRETEAYEKGYQDARDRYRIRESLTKTNKE